VQKAERVVNLVRGSAVCCDPWKTNQRLELGCILILTLNNWVWGTTQNNDVLTTN